MSENYENMSNEEIKEQLEWSDHHEFSYNYAIWACEEIERLNNIIDELEKWLIENKSGDISYSYSHTLNKLHELKEKNK